MSDATFKPIEKTQTPTIGPSAVLLCGFGPLEAESIRAFFQKIKLDAKIKSATLKMLSWPLERALKSDVAEPPLPCNQLPRTMILSGLTGQQIHAVLNEFKTLNIPRPIFCSATPNNLKITVKDLLIELLKEHRAMTKTPPPDH